MKKLKSNRGFIASLRRQEIKMYQQVSDIARFFTLFVWKYFHTQFKLGHARSYTCLEFVLRTDASQPTFHYNSKS